MTKEYQEQLQALLAQIDLGPEHNIQVKPFFGGAAAYTNGRIFLSLTKVGFAAKLPAPERQELLQINGAKPLQYFPNAPVKKEYVLLPDTMVNDPTVLRRWVIKSLAYATDASGAEKGNQPR